MGEKIKKNIEKWRGYGVHLPYGRLGEQEHRRIFDFDYIFFRSFGPITLSERYSTVLIFSAKVQTPVPPKKKITVLKNLYFSH